MSGEAEAILEVMERIKDQNEELRRTADPAQRSAIRSRIERDEAKKKQLAAELKRAAAAGDSEARELYKMLDLPIPPG